MKRPVFRAEASRDTNAPLEVVKAALQDKASREHWCLAPRADFAPAPTQPDGGIEIRYTQSGPLGLAIQGTLRATPSDTRVLLEHRTTIRGWAILILIGWYRWRIEGMWERFVRTLPHP